MADKDFDWPDPLPAPEFVMVPRLVEREIMPRLTGSEFKVFYCLMCRAYEWGTGSCEMTMPAIAAATGIARATVQETLKELERVHLVGVVRLKDEYNRPVASQYRVRVTDDARYVDRQAGRGVPDSGSQPGKSRYDTVEKAPPTRARSLSKNNSKKDVPTNQKSYQDDAYTRGRYGGLVLRPTSDDKDTG